MKKIPCLFKRDFSDRRRPILLEEVTPGCEWVLAGEGVATRKWDGTACMVLNDKLYARYDCKEGKIPPPGSLPCQPDPDSLTGHWPHWVPAEGPQYKWHQEAFVGKYLDDTYELVGPKVNGNPEHLKSHILIRHGADGVLIYGRSFSSLKSWLETAPFEGIVFHRSNGDMAKIRRDDYGFSWPIDDPGLFLDAK
jgi:hypothetical protein